MFDRFLDRPVEAGSVERILDVARRGPSAGFTQGFEFLVVEGIEHTAPLWDALYPPAERHDFDWSGWLAAPVVIVPLAHKQAYLDRYAEPDKGWTDKDEAHWPVPYWLFDASCAAMLILLAVVEEGLGATIVGMPERGAGALRDACGVPDDRDAVCVIAVGHPDPGDVRHLEARGRRRPLDDVVHRQRW